jgi:hypothetical protein
MRLGLRNWSIGIGSGHTRRTPRQVGLAAAIIRVPRPPDIADHPRRHARRNRKRGNVLCEHGAGANESAFTDADAAQHGHIGADRRPPTDLGCLYRPVCCRLHCSVVVGRARISIIGKHDAMTDKNLILNDHSLANERVGRYLASISDRGIALYLDEWTDEGTVADRAAVQIDERLVDDTNSLSKCYISDRHDSALSLCRSRCLGVQAPHFTLTSGR